MAKVKIGLRGLNAYQKLEKARSIEQAVNRSSEIDANALPLGELCKAANMLEKAISMAEFGDKRAVAAKRLCAKNVEATIRSMAHAAEQLGKGDRKVIEACGFEVRSTNNRSAPLEQPEGLTAKRLDTEGAVALKWSPVPNCKSYLVQMCTADTQKKINWQTGSYSTRSKCVIDALRPGKTYRFRILAIGAKGIGPPSTTVRIMAA
jgi:hypothetical protein